MTREECIRFGKLSALLGLDVGDVESHRENVNDTLTDEGAVDFIYDALRAFDAVIAAKQSEKAK